MTSLSSQPFSHKELLEIFVPTFSKLLLLLSVLVFILHFPDFLPSSHVPHPLFPGLNLFLLQVDVF